jgi:hypothetical protein
MDSNTEELRCVDLLHVGSTRGVGRKAGNAATSKRQTLGRPSPRFPFLSGPGAPFFQILNVRKQEHEHGVLF